MQEKTSSGYDILYPQTIAAQIEDVYSKDETITTATKALYGLGETATPNQVFSAISTALDGKARIQTGSYVGTGTYGASNPCSLTFDFNVNYLFIVLTDINKYGLVANYNTFSLMMSRFLQTYNYIGDYNYVSDNGYFDPKGWFSQNTFYWYNTGKGFPADRISEAQANKSGQIYYYVAF